LAGIVKVLKPRERFADGVDAVINVVLQHEVDLDLAQAGAGLAFVNQAAGAQRPKSELVLVDRRAGALVLLELLRQLLFHGEAFLKPQSA